MSDVSGTGSQAEDGPEAVIVPGPPEPVSGMEDDSEEPGVPMRELSLSEQPADAQLPAQPQVHAADSAQSEGQADEPANVDEEADVHRETHVGGDDFVFGHNFLPPFANAENKELNSKIKDHEEKLEAADVGLEEVNDRAQIMAEHLKSVQSELSYTQARVTSKRKEIQSEAHLKALSDRQLARYVADLKVIKKERGELMEKVSNLQNQIYRANEKMDQFKILMNWSQEELEQWTVTQQQKEEDSEAIERYAAQDRAKIKELDLAITRMNRTVAAHKGDLQREVTDTQSVQMQLRKAADDFESLHKERQDLIQQWEEAVAQMRRTDAAIQTASELFADGKLSLREKQRRLDIAAQFLDDQLANNKDCEGQIETLERDLARLRTEFNSRQSDYQEISEQVEIMKTMLSKAGNDHTRQQAENAGLAKELDAKRLRLDDMRKKVANNRRKLEGEYVHLDSLAAKEKELDTLANLEGKRLEEVDKSLRALEKVQFDKSQGLFKERQKEKDLISEISGGQAQNRNLVRRIQQLDDHVIRQQELLYNVEFQLQKMERRVARAQGERSDEETAALNSRIKVLTSQLEGVNAQHTMLLGQVRKAEDDLENANSARTRLTREREQVQSDLAALNLEADMVGRAVKKATSERQQKLVDLDVRKLEVQHLRESLNSRADEVFTLENRKLQLEQSLKERRHEISVHKQALEAELKLVKGDLHRVTQELQDRRQRVEKLEAKFAVVSTKKKSVYDEEEPKSQAYYVIKVAQQRQELQATGDRLDGENHRLQKEVATLERTLEQMAASNQAYNRSYKPVNEKRAFAERSKLRERLDKVYDRLKFKRQEERNLMGDVWQAELRVQQLQHEQDTLRQVVQELGRHKEEALAAVHREEEKMAESQGRFDHALASSGASEQELSCARLQLTKEATQSMLSHLTHIADQFPTLDIRGALEQADLRLEAEGSRPQSAASLAQGMGTLEVAA